MTETDDLSARLAALETVLRHLVTHLALRSDDPAQWVATRRTLALHEVHENLPRARDADTLAYTAELEQAITGFFEPVEGVLGAYASTGEGTQGSVRR